MTNPYDPNPHDPNQPQPYPGGYGADPYGQGAGPYGQGAGPYGQGTGSYGQPYPPPYGPGSPQPGPSPYSYGYPGYGQQPPQGTNGMAIASFVTSTAGLVLCGVACPVGAILGHIALSRIKQTGQPGRGLALAGVIIGWLATALLLVGLILIIARVNSAVSILEGGLGQPF